MAYAIVRTDLMSGTRNPADIVNVKYSPSGTDTAIENGHVVLLGALDTSERDVFVGATPSRNSDLSKCVLIATPEVEADERKKNLNEFRNAAGAICRGYYMRSGNVFSVTADALTNGTGGTIAIGDIVELQDGTKFKVVAAGTGSTEGSTPVGNIYTIEGDYYVIRVS
jgi:hypothetical protein